MKILFVSRGDACRSVIAAGLAKQVFGPQVTVDTAGIEIRQLHPVAVEM
jgi:protein-tyrosine-phosphatase